MKRYISFKNIFISFLFFLMYIISGKFENILLGFYRFRAIFILISLYFLLKTDNNSDNVTTNNNIQSNDSDNVTTNNTIVQSNDSVNIDELIYRSADALDFKMYSLQQLKSIKNEITNRRIMKDKSLEYYSRSINSDKTLICFASVLFLFLLISFIRAFIKPFDGAGTAVIFLLIPLFVLLVVLLICIINSRKKSKKINQLMIEQQNLNKLLEIVSLEVNNKEQ